MGWLVLAFLTALALVDAAGLAQRMAPRGRAELGMATALAFTALIGLPILALGYAGLLWRATLGPLSLAVLGSVFWGLSRREGAVVALDFAAGGVVDLARIPLDAFRETWRARSLVFVGLVACAALIAASLVLTYFVEFCRWDDEIYHTPIVGWSIQLHGFAIVDAPEPGVGGLNGYPKLCEALNLWFVFFTDKRLLELPATLYAPAVMLCVYALTRRFVDRTSAMGFAVVLLLVPHAYRQFCSSYVDMEVALFFLAATYYASVPALRMRDAWLCALAMTLAAASKTTWLVFVPPVALVAVVNLWRTHGAARRRDVVVTLALSFAAVTVVGALCVARNWWHYGNPVWPVAYDFPRIGVHWPGIFTPADYRGHDPPVVEGFEIPKGGMHDAMRHGYGMAVMWVAGPLGIAAMVVWGVLLARDVARRSLSDSVRGAAPIVFCCLVWLAVGPNFGQPRYNLHVIVAFLVACAWLLGGHLGGRFRQEFFGAALVLSLVPLAWAKDANPAKLGEELERLSHPFANRAYSERPTFDLLEREKYEQLGPGDEVVFSQGVAFPGLLWNFDFSNRVDYVAFTGGREFLAKLDALGAKWVCVGGRSAAERLIEQSGQWEPIGRTTPELDEVAFRRRH